MDKLRVLELTLHNQLVGYLAGFSSGKNILLFDNDFRQNEARPTLGLITHPRFPHSEKLLSQNWSRHHRLHPLLSNLLPEGALRELLAQTLKTHTDNEFFLFSALGNDLPGALQAKKLQPDRIPPSILNRLQISKLDAEFELNNSEDDANKFSLAGVQMKFSMKEKDGRFNFALASDETNLGDWIIKTPSTRHAFVPLNEYTTMKLASLVDVDIPEIKLVPIAQLEKLPNINLPQEEFAFAIKRFDRQTEFTDVQAQREASVQRVHMEDFAQVLVKYPHEKYGNANYEQIGQVLYQFSDEPIQDLQQYVRRLLVNILLANGDAHLKNWSLRYADGHSPRLSPAYDILTTQVYIAEERHFALNLAKNKDWYQTQIQHFQYFAEKVGVPWRVIKPHIVDVIEKARQLWPAALVELPMIEQHKKQLRTHWQQLHADFRLG